MTRDQVKRWHAGDNELTDDDWKTIDARSEAAHRGELASDEEVEAFFARYRLA